MAALLLTASAALAQVPATGASGYRPTNLVEAVISTLVFSVLGIVLAIGGFKLFDVIIPFDVEREICEKNNIAAAILAGAMVLGICLIVGMVVVS
jgi:uncharacterized membrane protein YjfL (UPF0719 family)